MKTILNNIYEALSNKNKKELDELIKHCGIDANNEVFIITKNYRNHEAYIYNTKSYDELVDLYDKIKTNPKEYGHYMTFQTSKQDCINICSDKIMQKYSTIDRTEE